MGRIVVWHMAPLPPHYTPPYPFFVSEVRISLPPPPSGPMGRYFNRNASQTIKSLHEVFGSCDIVLPMVCSQHLASAIVDSSFYAGVPVVPPPSGMACDAARHAVLGYGALEWLASPAPNMGGRDYNSIVRGLIANTSIWPVGGMLPPRLARAKLRASSLAYWAGGQYMLQALEVALERTLRMSLDVNMNVQFQHSEHRLLRFVPSSPFDCRKISLIRQGGGSNTYGSTPLACPHLHRADVYQVRRPARKQVAAASFALSL